MEVARRVKKPTMKKSLFWILLLATAGVSAYNFFIPAQEAKIAFVDLDEVFNGFDMKVELQQKLERELKEKEEVLDSILFDLSVAKTKAESPEAAEEVKMQYLRLQDYFFKEKKAYEQYSAEQTAMYDEQIIKQMSQYIEDFGKANQYKVILGKNNTGNVLYGDAGIDVTEALMAAINAEYQGL